jgi:hypothetical protein
VLTLRNFRFGMEPGPSLCRWPRFAVLVVAPQETWFPTTSPQAEARKALDIPGGNSRRVLAELGKVYAASGKTAEARAILKDVRQGTWKQPEPHYEVAILLAALGEKEAALKSLKTAIDLRLSRIVWIKSLKGLNS